MSKLFKVFVTFCMVTALAIGGSVPTMAAEGEETNTALEAVSTTEMESRAGVQVGGTSGHCTIKPGSVIGTCYVSTGAKTIEVTITGVSGFIILQFDNLNTGDRANLTATGGQTSSVTYVSTLDSGDWQCSVLTCKNNASNCSFDINFYR